MKRDFSLCLLLCLSTLAGCSDSGPMSANATESPSRRLDVAVTLAERRTLSQGVQIAADFRPYQEVDLHAKVAGYLQSIQVDVGDRVRQGQVIGVLEVPEFEQELAQASATERRSELDVVRAESEVQRAQSALDLRKLMFGRILSASQAKPNLIAQQELDTVQAQAREAEANLATANAMLASVKQQVRVNAAQSERVRTMLTYLRVTAPFSGIVTRRYADPGAMIQAGTASQTQAMPLVRIAQIDRLRLILPVPESIVANVRIGTRVEVRVDALQRVYLGRVARFAGQLNPSTRTMETEVDIKNADGALHPGMYGYASLVLKEKRETIALPVQSVTQGTRRTVLVVSKKGEVQEREVRTGIETANYVEILEGVAENELVVTGNRGAIRPKTLVNVKVLDPRQMEGGE